MRTLSGTPSNKFNAILGEIAVTKRPIYDRSRYILATDHLDASSLGYLGCITSGDKGNCFCPNHLYHVQGLGQLNDGDIVLLSSDGRATVLWEEGSDQNGFLLTEACKCNCIMCPQPPKKHDPSCIQESNRVLDLLYGHNVEAICITGGEPTLLGDEFIRFLERCIQEHPNAHIDVLTNGKKFADEEFARSVAEVTTTNVRFCVSLHSEIDIIHDHIVGSRGSYVKTQQGIYNLANVGCIIEIRHVLCRQNLGYLQSFVEHLYNYMPFCNHYAIMGMEFHGYAEKNKEMIDISPSEYKKILRDAVITMSRRNMPVSVYNIPLCMCEPEIRCFAAQSISKWKNCFPSQCAPCECKDSCAGFFSTSSSLPIEYIQPLKKEEK